MKQYRRIRPVTREDRKRAIQWERLKVRCILDGDDGFAYAVSLKTVKAERVSVITAWFHPEFIPPLGFKATNVYTITTRNDLGRLRTAWERDGWLPHRLQFSVAPMVKYGC